jgi:hypothetical protein
MSLKHLYPIAVTAILGCASASVTSDTAGMGPVRSNPKLLTAEEIGAAHADVVNAYDAIARLRPNWLVSHGPVSSNPQASPFATVFVDGQQYQPVSAVIGLMVRLTSMTEFAGNPPLVACSFTAFASLAL